MEYAVTCLSLYFALSANAMSTKIKYVRPGATQILVCPYKSPRIGIAVKWRGPPQLSLYSINDFLMESLSDSVSVIANFTAGEYKLAISNFSKDKEGHYQCDTVRVGKALKERFELRLTETVVEVYPATSSCKQSKFVNLKCQLDDRTDSTFTNVWLHEHSGILIRELYGSTEGNISTLIIPFCVYKDAGNYTCTWTSTWTEASAVGNIAVQSQPVFLKKDVSFNNSSLQFRVVFYSIPEPKHITWYHNDYVVGVKRDSELFSEITVQLPVYEQAVNTSGFVATMTMKYYSNKEIGTVECQIQNGIGIADVSFDNKLVLAALPKYESDESEIYGATWTVISIVCSGILCTPLVVLICIVVQKRRIRVFYTDSTRITRRQDHEQGMGLETISLSQDPDGHVEHAYEEINDADVSNIARPNVEPNNSGNNVVIEENAYLDVAPSYSYEDVQQTGEDNHAYRTCSKH